MLLRFIDSSALLSAETVQNKCLIVYRTHLVLASGKLVLPKKLVLESRFEEPEKKSSPKSNFNFQAENKIPNFRGRVF